MTKSNEQVLILQRLSAVKINFIIQNLFKLYYINNENTVENIYPQLTNMTLLKVEGFLIVFLAIGYIYENTFEH